MSNELRRSIPGNFERGIIRNQDLDIGNLQERIQANELLECRLHGTASSNYGQLGPNLISCEVDEAFFPSGVSHFDAKDTTFTNVRIYEDFTRIMVTRCVFQNVTFTRAKLRDTVFLDSYFERVIFEDCDFSVTVFKSNLFVACRFVNCRTDNKVFEHCVFDESSIEQTRLQEITILQNFGIRRSDTTHLQLYAPERGGEDVDPKAIHPANSLERICLEYFLAERIDGSEELWNVVNLRFSRTGANNALHLLTAIEQLAKFLLLLFGKGELRAHFIIQLYWSLEHLLDSVTQQQAAVAYTDRIQAASMRLRPIYEQVASLVPEGDRYDVLVAEGYTRKDVQDLFDDVTSGVQVASVETYNSPSIAHLVFDQPAEAALIAVLIFATRFKLEIDAYRPYQRVLMFETRLLGGEQPREYAALIAMNIPGLLFARLRVGLALSVLERLRTIVLTIITPKVPPPPHQGPGGNQGDS